MPIFLYILITFFIVLTICFHKINKEMAEIENNPLPPPEGYREWMRKDIKNY
jgi:hypothetical protein